MGALAWHCCRGQSILQGKVPCLGIVDGAQLCCVIDEHVEPARVLLVDVVGQPFDLGSVCQVAQEHLGFHPNLLAGLCYLSRHSDRISKAIW